jgi:hypothetical protein
MKEMFLSDACAARVYGGGQYLAGMRFQNFWVRRLWWTASMVLDGEGVGDVPAAAVAIDTQGFALALGCREGSLRSTEGPLPMSRPAARNSGSVIRARRSLMSFTRRVWSVRLRLIALRSQGGAFVN